MDYLVQQVGIDHILHFFVCFVMLIILAARVGKKNLCLAMLFIFGMMAFKEAFDIFANVHHMTIPALVCDSLWDLAADIFGLVAAAICIERTK